MNAPTLIGFLFGRRDAIIRVASSPAALGLGLLFVVSAGFAREYDGEDLLREPWHLLIPLAASLVSCTTLFLLLLVGSLIVGAPKQNWLSNYRRFLTLFWMTAPLAWLYAIPWERWVSAGDAMRLNLALLGIVSLWRVILMIRVVSVIFGALLDAIFFVMLFADSVALLAIELTPKPIVSMMGGIRHTESEQLLLDTTCLITFFGALLLPVWVLGVLAIAIARRIGPEKNRWRPRFGECEPPVGLSLSAWGLGAFACLAGILLLPIGQPEQQLRSQVEEAFAESDVDSVLRILSAHKPGDFPPHYDPPPRPGYGLTDPSLIDVLTLALEGNTAEWVTQLYTDKFVFHGRSRLNRADIQNMDDEHLEQYIDLLHRLPDGKQVALAHKSEVYVALHVEDDRTPKLNERRRKLYQRLEELLPPRDEEAEGEKAEGGRRKAEGEKAEGRKAEGERRKEKGGRRKLTLEARRPGANGLTRLTPVG